MLAQVIHGFLQAQESGAQRVMMLTGIWQHGGEAGTQQAVEGAGEEQRKAQAELREPIAVRAGDARRRLSSRS